VAKLFVDEGMKPKKGEVLAELDQEVIKARRDQAEAQVKELEPRGFLGPDDQDQRRSSGCGNQPAKAGVKAADARYQSLKTGSREQEIAEAAAARTGQVRVGKQGKGLPADEGALRDPYRFRESVRRGRTTAEAGRAAYEAALERYKLVKAGPVMNWSWKAKPISQAPAPAWLPPKQDERKWKN